MVDTDVELLYNCIAQFEHYKDHIKHKKRDLNVKLSHCVEEFWLTLVELVLYLYWMCSGLVFYKLAANCSKWEDRKVETAKNVNYAAGLGKFISIFWKQI